MNILKTKIVGVKFTNGNANAANYEKQYHYFTDDMSIQKDDYCIVIGASGAPAVVRVYEDDVMSSKASKMILCKIDLAAYREKQRTIVARTAALNRLKQLDEELSAADRYKHLASKSDEARELLEALGMLMPTTAIEGSVNDDSSNS